MPFKRRKGKQASAVRIVPEPSSPDGAEEQVISDPVPAKDNNHPPSPSKEPPLVLTSDKRRGVYECDYCHADISQVPRIRCAVCPDFDLCLECFSSADHVATTTALKALQDSHKASSDHDETHGYRVADSTRYVLFPPSRSVVPSRPSSFMDTDDGTTSSDGDTSKTIHPTTGTLHPHVDMGKSAVDPDKPIESKKVEKEKEQGDNIEAEDIIMEDASSEKQDARPDKDTTKETAVKEAFTTVPTDGNEKQDEMDTDTEKADSESVLVVQEDPKCTWTVEEDLRLLDAIATFGLGNWADIAEAIAGQGSSNKTPKRCMERYLDDYLGRYGHILPPYTVGENSADEAIDEDGGKDEAVDDTAQAAPASKRRRLSLMKSYSTISIIDQGTGKKKGVVTTASLPNYDEVWPNAYLPPIPSIQNGQEVGRVSKYRAEQTFVKELSQATSKEEADKLRKLWEETRLNQPDGPTALPVHPDDIEHMYGSNLAGYMPRRGDFDMEWENDAEAIIADMEFSPNDLPQDRQLKIQIIDMYNAKLDERERRKQFLVSRGLLDYRKIQKEEDALPRDERDIVRRMRLFERFHTREEHKQFINDILKAKRLREEIAKLQTYRRMGITSLAEAEKFELHKARRDFHKNAYKQKQAAAQKVAEGAVGFSGDRFMHQGETESSSYWKQYKTTRVRRSINRSPDGPAQHKDAEEGKEGEVLAPAIETSTATTAMTDTGSDKDSSVKEGLEKVADASEVNEMTDASPENQGGETTPKTPDSKIVCSPGYELLFSKEVTLCKKLDLLPAQYLEVKSAIIQESIQRGLIDKGTSSSRRTIVKIDTEKRGDVVDFLVRAGWISSKMVTATRRRSSGNIGTSSS